jgi:hypothetical protein
LNGCYDPLVALRQAGTPWINGAGDGNRTHAGSSSKAIKCGVSSSIDGWVRLACEFSRYEGQRRATRDNSFVCYRIPVVDSLLTVTNVSFPEPSASRGTMQLWHHIECRLWSMTSSNSLLTFNVGFALLFLLGGHPPAVAESTGEIITAAPHMCVVIAPGEMRPEFGCFRIGIAKDLKLKRATIYWHLYSFRNRADADIAKTRSGIVVEEDGRVWLSEFGSRNRRLRGGHRIAVVGPLKLLPAESYTFSPNSLGWLQVHCCPTCCKWLRIAAGF